MQTTMCPKTAVLTAVGQPPSLHVYGLLKTVPFFLPAKVGRPVHCINAVATVAHFSVIYVF